MYKKLIVMSAASLVLSMSFANQIRAEDVPVVVIDATSSSTAPDGMIKIEVPKQNTDTHQVLEDVVVTATKTGKSVSQAPASVSVITSKNLETKNVHRAEEALTGLAGIYIKGAGDHAPSDNSGTVVYMRGVPGLGRTAVLQDGQSMNDPFSGGVNWSGIFADSIEKIEVVRGPFSSIYGGNAIGGVINFITKEPTKREITVKAGYGSHNLKAGSAVYKNKIDRLGLSIGYGHEKSDGYAAEEVVKPVATGTGTIPVTGWQYTTNPNGGAAYLVGDKGKRWWWKDNVDMKLFFDITPTSKVTLRASWNQHETGFTGLNTYLRDAAGNPVVSGSVIINDGSAKRVALSELDFLLGENGANNSKINLGYETTLDNLWAIKVDAGYMDAGYWYSSALTGATSNAGPGKLVDIPNNRYYTSIQATVPTIDRHVLIVGVSANRDALHKREYNLANWQDRDALGTVRYSVDGENTTYAVFAQDEYYLLDNVTFYVGGRYDYWSTEGSDNQTTPLVSSHVFEKRSASAVSPKIAAVYMLQENTSLRASIGNAFKGPSMSQLYSSFSGYQSNPALEPEKSTSWEFGAEHRFADQTMVRATYYQNILKNLIYTTTISPGVSTPKNAGKGDVKGVELEIRKPVSEGVTTFANFTYNKALITENASLPLTVGKRITGTPQRMLNIGVEARKGDWTTSLTGSHVSDVYSNDQNLDVVNGVYTATDPYTVWSAKANYEIRQGLRASVAVDNLFDKQYYQYYKVAGRTFYSELKLDF